MTISALGAAPLFNGQFQGLNQTIEAQAPPTQAISNQTDTVSIGHAALEFSTYSPQGTLQRAAGDFPEIPDKPPG